jgi:hypothetical protein
LTRPGRRIAADRELGTVLTEEIHQLGRIVGLTDDVKARAFEKARQTLTQEDVVIRQDRANRRRRHTTIMGHCSVVGTPVDPPSIP